MALPTSGVITIADINIALGRAADAPFDTTDSEVLALAQRTALEELRIPDDFYGKSLVSEIVLEDTAAMTYTATTITNLSGIDNNIGTFSHNGVNALIGPQARATSSGENFTVFISNLTNAEYSLLPPTINCLFLRPNIAPSLVDLTLTKQALQGSFTTYVSPSFTYTSMEAWRAAYGGSNLYFKLTLEF